MEFTYPKELEKAKAERWPVLSVKKKHRDYSATRPELTAAIKFARNVRRKKERVRAEGKPLGVLNERYIIIYVVFSFHKVLL